MPDTFVVQIEDRSTPGQTVQGPRPRTIPSTPSSGVNPNLSGQRTGAVFDSLSLLSSGRAGGTAARAAGSLGARGLGALGATGAAGIGVGVGIGLLAIGAFAAYRSFQLLNTQVANVSERLTDLPGQLQLARLENELLDFQQSLQQAAQFGENLAENERALGRQRRATRDISATLTNSFTPLVTETNRGIANLVESLEPLTNLTAATIEAALTPVVTALEGINIGVEFINSRGEFLIEAVRPISPALASLLTFFREESTDEQFAELTRELYDFISPNNPNLQNAQGQRLPLEFNLDI